MPDTPDAGGGKPITSIKRLRQRADYAARHSPYDYQSHDEQGYPGYDAELDMRAADDLAEAVGLLRRYHDLSSGVSGDCRAELWHDTNAFLARFAKDTP
ncbi:MAG: hypothetical protein KDB18_10180 [Salinibacterium sp.]|nr:hypothetical protein [Salinibacterium sp.]